MKSSSALSTANSQIEEFDPFAESLKYLLVIAFPKSSSQNFPIALSVAQSASRFTVTEIGGKRMFAAGFDSSLAEAGKAVALLGYVKGWRGVMAFSGGAVVPFSQSFVDTMSCYLQAGACRDSRAHCHVLVDDPNQQQERRGFYFSISTAPQAQETVDVPQFIFPCRRLREKHAQLDPTHPASLQDQIQASAVKHGIHICPKFNPDDLVPAGISRKRTIY